MGIGHTRWATHGKPSAVNSHPHMDNSKTFSVVHNGIIENYNELRNFLTDLGYNKFKAQALQNMSEKYFEEVNNFKGRKIVIDKEIKDYKINKEDYLIEDNR